jgi:LCP family protein required for cell wall assembly
MTRSTRIVLSLMAAFALLVCCALPATGYAGYIILHALGRPTGTPVNTASPLPLTPSATSTPAPVCGGPPVMFILLIGSDTRSNGYATGLADSIRIVRVDFVHPGVMLLSFQRDMYVEIPGISEHGGITHGKLNQAYLYGNSAFGYYDGPGQGPGLLALTMQQNFGTRVDHYTAVNLHTFVRVVDALGGLDITLPAVVDGRSPGFMDPILYFPAGYQHLDGDRTVVLARLRPQGDFQRSTDQDLILRALAAKVLSPAVIPQLPQLIQAFYGSVQTDLGAAELGQLLCLAGMLDPQQDITFHSFPESLFRGVRIDDPVLGRPFVWDVDFNILRAYVGYFNAGTWPETIPSP